IFNTGCNGDNYGGTAALRASFVATCKANPTASVCTSTFVNGVGGTTVAACNADAFIDMDGCNTHPAFNAERISICTTEATSFTAGCNDTDYVGTNDAQVKLVAACAITPGGEGCDTRIDGSDITTGTTPTVAMCNTDPFLDTGCGASPLFNAGRMSICTTDATSFHAGCSEATYTGTDAARTSFAEACAAGTVTAGCDTAYLNGVDGLTVATCNANPFDTANDCATNSAFDAERTARNTLCAADASTAFDTRCEIAEFGDDNEVNRNTYCRETALPAEGVASANCGDARFTAICGDTTQVETNNPFAPLCGTTNTAERAAFCLLGSMQTDNPNCSEDVMAQCNRNPFGTTLGKDGTINCTADYAGQRKILADACRPATVDTTLAVFANDGATCTDAINNCNANPFGNGCDADAFADARTSYCTDPATTWQGACDASADESTQNAVTVARSGVCAANGAIMTGTVADDVADGESLFHADCLALTGVTDLVTINAARTDYCANDDNPWQGNCDTVAGLNSGDNAVVTARNDVCLNNGAIPSNGANSEVILAGDSLFNALCGTVATIATVREAECETPAFAWHTGCESFVTATDAEVIAARAKVCFDDLELDRGGASVVIAEGASFFDALCDGQVDANAVEINVARLNHCKEAGNAWQSGCGRFDSGQTLADAD
ncbi:MAG: hypothetical protein K8953_01000, partial [Proteobacteria bacterium]|nr:hypothetical protein [Pseudomonadota bacterium]